MRQQQLVRSILGIFHLLFAPLLRAVCSSLTSKRRTASPSSKNFPRLPPARFRNASCEVDRPLSLRSRLIQILSWFPVSKLPERDISPRGTTSDFLTLSFLVCLRAVGTFFV